MVLFAILPAILLLFMPFVLLAGHKRASRDEIMTARLGLVRAQVSVGSGEDSYEPGEQELTKGKALLDLPLASRASSKILELLNFRTLAVRAGSTFSGPAFLGTCTAVALGTGVVVWFVSRRLLETSLLACAAGYVPVMLLQMQCGRRLKRMEVVLPQVVEMIARALRAGHSLPAAFSIVAEQAPEPARQEFGELFRKQKLGFPLREALLELLDRVPSQDLRVLVVGILVQRETGGNLTVILDRTSSVIRERLKLQGDVLVHTAQGRLTGWILCALPILLFAMISVVNPGYTRELTNDPIGRECLYGGVGLLVVGAFLIRKIVNGIEV